MIDIEKENKELKDKLEEFESDILYFERLAQEWKLGHDDLKVIHNRKVKELEQIIEELQKELNEKSIHR